MKKLGIILMVFCLTLSLLTVPALADGEKVITLTHNTGFIQEGFDDSAITANGYPFRTYKNWITVDVSDLAGTYSIDAVYKNNGAANYRHSALNLIIDGAVKTRIYTPSTGGWSNTNTATVSATVYIPAATQVMKIERIGAENVVLDSLTFNYLNAADTASEEIEIYAMNISLSDAPSTTKGVKNTDYYHAEGDTGNNPVINGGNPPAIIHRGGRDDLYWSRYDISGVAPGLYEIELTRGCTGAASSEILIDGTSALTGTHAASGGYFTYTPANLGQVSIPAGAQYLTVKALTGAYYFHSFKLIPVATSEPEAPLAVTYSTDAAGDNEIDTIGSNTSIYANISVNAVFDAAKVYVVHYNAANPECYVLTTAQVQDLADGLQIQVTGLGANSVVKTFIWDATTFIPLMDEVSIN